MTEEDGALLHDMAEQYKLRLYYLTDARPSRTQDIPGILSEVRSTVPTGRETRLGDAIHAVLDDLRGATPAGIVLLTDGINTDGAPLAEAAEYARPPRRAAPSRSDFGSEEPLRDLKLSDLLVDDVVFVDDVVNFECKLSSSGVRRQRSRGRASRKGQAGRVGQGRCHHQGRSAVATGPHSLPPHAGSDNSTTWSRSNPRKVRFKPRTTVRRARSKFVRRRSASCWSRGSPSFEFRYLRNMLGRDETIALRTVLQEGPIWNTPSRTRRRFGAFPVRREELFAYDVVIFGDVNPSLLSAAALQSLADFVDQDRPRAAHSS